MKLLYDSDTNQTDPNEIYKSVLEKLGINDMFCRNNLTASKGGIMNSKLYKTVKQKFVKRKVKGTSTRKKHNKNKHNNANTKRPKYKRSKKTRYLQ